MEAEGVADEEEDDAEAEVPPVGFTSVTNRPLLSCAVVLSAHEELDDLFTAEKETHSVITLPRTSYSSKLVFF